MKRFLFILIIFALGYGGYQYYLGHRLSRLITPPKSNLSDKLVITQANLGNLGKILGVATDKVLKSGDNLLNKITNNEGEPLINKTVNNLKQEIKDLPKEQYDKVKYEFCKDVVVKYENPAPTTTN